MTRRRLLAAGLNSMWLSLMGCAGRAVIARPCSGASEDFVRVEEFAPRTVLRTGPPSGARIILLHELPGLSPVDMGLARCLAAEGFSVYMPLMFGTQGQDNWLFGYFQSCATASFECSKLSTSSPILGWIRSVCRRVADDSTGPVGAIGMCLTGAFPLALLEDPRVRGAILCQPTVPFGFGGKPNGEQKSDLGLDRRDLDAAVRSRVPILALRYAGDPKCPPERMQTLSAIFGEKLALIELESAGHSTLASDYDGQAFADAVAYLQVALMRKPGPSSMRLAKVGGRPCDITSDGRWRVTP